MRETRDVFLTSDLEIQQDIKDADNLTVGLGTLNRLHAVPFEFLDVHGNAKISHVNANLDAGLIHATNNPYGINFPTLLGTAAPEVDCTFLYFQLENGSSSYSNVNSLENAFVGTDLEPGHMIYLSNDMAQRTEVVTVTRTFTQDQMAQNVAFGGFHPLWAKPGTANGTTYGHLVRVVEVSLPLSKSIWNSGMGLRVYKVRQPNQINLNCIAAGLIGKNIYKIELLGYMLNQLDIRLADQHNQHDHDYLYMEMDGMMGGVSTNTNLLPFAVLPGHNMGGASDNIDQKKHVCNFYNGYGPSKSFESGVQLPRLMIKLKDRSGKPAPIGRAHFWLRLEVGPATSLA